MTKRRTIQKLTTMKTLPKRTGLEIRRSKIVSSPHIETLCVDLTCQGY